jgi:transposase InsO family protein
VKLNGKNTAVRHPQTNGKVEKWFHTYKRFRGEFETFEDFIQWYNRRPHGALELGKIGVSR